jgi:hypothetical protein
MRTDDRGLIPPIPEAIEVCDMLRHHRRNQRFQWQLQQCSCQSCTSEPLQ